MSEPKIGRVLASSLHQAISEVMPTRVEFYESWLTPARIRRGELGRARITAVISFLRQEGDDYETVVDRAGRYTADLTVDTLPAIQRAVVRRLPRPIRVRVVLRMAGRMIRGLHDEGRLEAAVRRGTAVVAIDGSLFCDVRETAPAPLCRYYGALIERCLDAFDLTARARSSQCRAAGDGRCELIIKTGGGEEPVGE